MELIDIFDENNKFTGKVMDRKEATEKGLWRRTVSCWIMNQKGEILLQKRTANKSRNPNKWAKTGGQVDSEESVVQAIYREVKEELGIEVPKKQIKILNECKLKDCNNKRFAYNFIFFVNYKINEYILQKEEVAEVKYYSIEELEKIKENNNKNFTFCNWDSKDFYKEIKSLKEERAKIIDRNKKEDELSKILENNYLIKPLEIVEINRGTAEIHKITTATNEYILKIFSQGRTKELILKEVNIINFLEQRQIKVPNYKKTKNGEYYIEYNNQYVVLQEFIKGYTMENNTCGYDRVIESASILGKLTNALKDYQELEEDGIIKKWFSKESITNGLEKIRELSTSLNEDNKYSDKIKQDLIFKEKISKEILKSFDFDILNKITIMNSHGDYSVQQLIYNDNKETTVIDFETAKKLPIVWEVIRSYSYIDKDVKNGEFNMDTLVEYFIEFSKYILLNKYDLMYATNIYLIQLVSSVFGYKHYNENSEKQELLEFAFFRTKLCRYLYENKNEITENLMKKIRYKK